MPLDTLEVLTNEPKLMLDVERLQNGGILILVLAIQTPINDIARMLGALGALNKITPSEIV